MKHIPYRDYDGYIIHKPYRPVLKDDDGQNKFRENNNRFFFEIMAKYVYCPEINSLKHWKNCKDCEFFIKAARRYVWCESKKNNTPPPYYDVIRPTVKRKYKQRKKKGETNETNHN